MQQHANLKKKDYVAISSISWFNEEWSETDFPPWEPSLSRNAIPTPGIPRQFYFECRSQSHLLKDKRLNKYWAVWIVTCMKDVHTRVSIEWWTSIDGLSKCVLMYQHRNRRYFENRSMQTSSMLEKYHKCRSVTLPWSKKV